MLADKLKDQTLTNRQQLEKKLARQMQTTLLINLIAIDKGYRIVG